MAVSATIQPVTASDGVSATVSARWWVWFWPALAATLVGDLASKSYVFSLPRYGNPPWIRHDYNTGIAWSMLRDHPGFVAALTFVLIPVLAAIWWRGYRRLGRCENLAFGLILGGALGNAWDRAWAVAGHWPGVRDFIMVDLGFPPFDPWPIFNLADSGITIGFLLLLAVAFRPAAKPAPAETRA